MEICIPVCCISFIVICIISFYSIELNIGIFYRNSTCYSKHYMTSLSDYLCIKSVVGFIVIATITILIICIFCCTKKAGWPLFLVLFSNSIFTTIMTIVGIIELIYQFPGCKEEVKNVVVMVIIDVIFGILFCFGSHTIKINSIKRYDYEEL
jgi:hypothetical protein